MPKFGICKLLKYAVFNGGLFSAFFAFALVVPIRPVGAVGVVEDNTEIGGSDIEGKEENTFCEDGFELVGGECVLNRNFCPGNDICREKAQLGEISPNGECLDGLVFDCDACDCVPNCGISKKWNSATMQCECIDTCSGQQNPDTCECEESIYCGNGYYMTNGDCQKCPDADGVPGVTWDNDGADVMRIKGCTVFSNGEGPSSDDGNNIMAGIGGCFISSQSKKFGADDYCSYSDETGTFVYTQDCYWRSF